MKIEWIVRHCPVNPKHNESIECKTKKEAIEEIKTTLSDEKNQGISSIYKNGELVAQRKWEHVRIAWNVPIYKKIL